MSDRADLEHRIQYTFTDKPLLDLALTHRSATVDSAVTAPEVTNERLEFLGDRVLGLAIADMLYAHFSAEPEGSMARRLAALVSRESLADIAVQMSLQDYVQVGGSEAEGESRTASISANACEALIGAVFLDGGFAAAKDLVVRYWRPLMEANVNPPKDSKTELQEWAQGQGFPLPIYTLIETTGPAHSPEFKMSVKVDGQDPAVGIGASKRTATQVAAAALLERIK
ncbi:MAG: ribonuclease III [Alphaproteobacteria bacterium]|nr:ribonuclease III [Alphaproteobacteria bacterium]